MAASVVETGGNAARVRLIGMGECVGRVEAVAEVEGVGVEESLVAFMPASGGEVGREAAHRVLDALLVEGGQGGDGGADVRVEVVVRASPVGTQESVGAVGGHRYRDDGHPRAVAPEVGPDDVNGGKPGVGFGDLREIFTPLQYMLGFGIPCLVGLLGAPPCLGRSSTASGSARFCSASAWPRDDGPCPHRLDYQRARGHRRCHGPLVLTGVTRTRTAIAVAGILLIGTGVLLPWRLSLAAGATDESVMLVRE
ncbi:hypothetical protein [Nonomuraea sp. NPDC049400]|uniref:hypothetical protein n=1 Tax=Nonomuraea sp. NPDC049400 TaxID=3364352 RepID=UPI00379E56C7